MLPTPVTHWLDTCNTSMQHSVELSEYWLIVNRNDIAALSSYQRVWMLPMLVAHWLDTPMTSMQHSVELSGYWLMVNRNVIAALSNY